MSDTVVPAVRPDGLVRNPCECWTCNASRALDSLHAALDHAIDSGTERDMSHAWLRDEVEAFVISRKPWGWRRRLRRALKAVS